MKLTLTLLLLLSLSLAAIAEPGWEEYVNPRFGFKMSYPPELVAISVSAAGGGLVSTPDAPNGAGRSYHTADGEFNVTAQGHFLNGATLESFWEEELKEYGSNITYKRKAADWYVVSGVKDGLEFYRKLHVKGGNWAEISFTYPHAKAAQYDPWVEKMVKSFVPFLQGDYDRAPK